MFVSDEEMSYIFPSFSHLLFIPKEEATSLVTSERNHPFEMHPPPTATTFPNADQLYLSLSLKESTPFDQNFENARVAVRASQMSRSPILLHEFMHNAKLDTAVFSVQCMRTSTSTLYLLVCQLRLQPT